MSKHPNIESIRFPVRIGEKTLFTTQLQMLVVKSDFLDGDVSRDEHLVELEERPDADGILFRSIKWPANHERYAIRGALLLYVPQRFSRYYTILEGTFDEYQRKFSSKTRSSLRRKTRKLAEQFDGEMRMVVYTQPEEMRDFHQLARTVSSTTYQERLFDEGLPDSEEFCAAMIQAASRNQAVGFLLFGHERPIAYIYCPQEGRRLLYRYVGYDTEFARLSPGTVLQWLAFEYLFEHRNGAVFDFTEGEGEHKKFFGTQYADCANVYYLRRSPKAMFVVSLHELSDQGNRFFGWVLEKLRLKSMIKRLIRS